jgi:hypothetical protein
MKERNGATDIQGGGEMAVGGGDEPLTQQVYSSQLGAAKDVVVARRRRGGRHLGCHPPMMGLSGP